VFAREKQYGLAGEIKMKKIGPLLALVCANAFAEPLARFPTPSEGCVVGEHYKAEIESQVNYHRDGRRISRNFYHAQEARATPEHSYPQTVHLQPYFSGFCNPAFPSSCPR
jgi:hypothetical protein